MREAAEDAEAQIAAYDRLLRKVPGPDTLEVYSVALKTLPPLSEKQLKFYEAQERKLKSLQKSAQKEQSDVLGLFETASADFQKLLADAQPGQPAGSTCGGVRGSRREGSMSAKAILGVALTVIAASLAGGGVYAVNRLKQKKFDPATLCPLEGSKAASLILIDKTDPLTAAEKASARSLVAAEAAAVQRGDRITVRLLRQKEGADGTSARNRGRSLQPRRRGKSRCSRTPNASPRATGTPSASPSTKRWRAWRTLAPRTSRR